MAKMEMVCPEPQNTCHTKHIRCACMRHVIEDCAIMMFWLKFGVHIKFIEHSYVVHTNMLNYCHLQHDSVLVVSHLTSVAWKRKSHSHFDCRNFVFVHFFSLSFHMLISAQLIQVDFSYVVFFFVSPLCDEKTVFSLLLSTRLCFFFISPYKNQQFDKFAVDTKYVSIIFQKVIFVEFFPLKHSVKYLTVNCAQRTITWFVNVLNFPSRLLNVAYVSKTVINTCLLYDHTNNSFIMQWSPRSFITTNLRYIALHLGFFFSSAFRYIKLESLNTFFFVEKKIRENWSDN